MKLNTNATNKSTTDYKLFREICPTIFADVKPAVQAMAFDIRPIVPKIDRIAGPAFPVQCSDGDILSLHKAVYLARPGDVLVVKSDANNYAVLGGNFAMLAKKRGIAAIIVDGVIRDLDEVRASGIAVFSKGIFPIAGTRKHASEFPTSVVCGGITVNRGDVIVADEEGVIVIAQSKAQEVLQQAQMRAEKEQQQSFEAWESAHRQLVESAWGQ